MRTLLITPKRMTDKWKQVHLKEKNCQCWIVAKQHMNAAGDVVINKNK